MTALNSSWITDAEWSNGTLTLTMNGRTYDYTDADKALYDGIVSAPSAGEFYNRHIKGNVGTSNRLGTALARTGLLTAGRLLTRGFGA